MMNIFWNGVLSLILAASSMAMPSMSNTTYFAQRDQLLSEDISYIFGEDLTLSVDEELVNSFIMEYKNEEYTTTFTTLQFPPSLHFFQAKSRIAISKVYDIILQMPKGASLHVHDLGTSYLRWVVSNLTYWDDLYMCNSTDDVLLFRFFDTPNNDSCGWTLVSEARAAYETVIDFDVYIFRQLSLYTGDPETKYPDINSVWKAFQDKFTTITGLVTYVEAWKAYLTRALQEMVDDNISYVEIRSTLPLLYEKNNTIYSEKQTMDVLKEIIDNFTNNNKDRFMGARIIYAPLRSYDVADEWKYVDQVIQLRELYPELIAGFDLVGQEDLGPPLINILDPLLALSEQIPPIPVFYHAGETDWEGMSTDENLFDALLLNVTRIGHGFGIAKHPSLIQMARDRDVPIEVCPISNQVLMLVADLRNHPAVALASTAFQMVVSSDDYAIWGATPLSHDFYEAFMGFGGKKADLRFMKKLALNSIRYSSLNPVDKISLQDLWVGQWDNFIQSTISNNNLTMTF